MKKVQGFTLIELMIVIAILGILMAIAIPAYQDYTVRAKVSECVNAVAPAKLGISEFVISNARFPANVASFGTLFTTEFCNLPSYNSSGLLTINPNSTGVGSPVSITIDLSPTTDAGGNVIWECNATAGSQYAPATCR